jgi:uncharacterized protein (TIGR02996 family)
MLPGSEPFLAAIRAAPADDLPRLVFADWLDEHGDPDRAEFIRVQCELAKHGRLGAWTDVGWRADDLGRSTLAPAAPLLARQTALWSAHGEEWSAELPQSDLYRVEFHRGFAGTVTPLTGAWAQVRRPLAALFDAAPVDGIVFQRQGLGCARHAVNEPWLGRLRSVCVFGGNPYRETDPGAVEAGQAVAIASRLAGLEELCMPGVGIGDIGAVTLSRNAWVRNLRRVDLSRNGLRDRGAARLAVALDPAKVVVLDLSGNRIIRLVADQLRDRFGDRVYLGE